MNIYMDLLSYWQRFLLTGNETPHTFSLFKKGYLALICVLFENQNHFNHWTCRTCLVLLPYSKSVFISLCIGWAQRALISVRTFHKFREYILTSLCQILLWNCNRTLKTVSQRCFQQFRCRRYYEMAAVDLKVTEGDRKPGQPCQGLMWRDTYR